MNDAGLNLAGLGLIATGGVLLWSGVNDPEGGPLAVVRDLLKGKMPTAGVQLVTGAWAGAVAGGVQAGGDFLDNGGASGGGNNSQGGAGVGSMGRVVDVARGYLGAPYAWGGSTRKGIDCSGLVLVAYRDGAGIKLPHRATAQAARGRRVPRDQARAGDLVAWGVPGNYPHIALAVDNTQCIGAWTYGVPCRYGKIDQKAVPGFGFPDIVRIVG